MKHTQHLIIKQRIARICVLLIICTTVVGTFLAFSGENNPAKKHVQTESILKENNASGNPLIISYKNK